MKRKIDAPIPYTLSESEIQRQVIQAVNASGLARVWRTQSGTRSGGRMHLAPTGTPDIVGYTRFGRFLGLEVKRPGKGPSKAQQDVGTAILASGGLWVVVASADSAIAYLRSLTPLPWTRLFLEAGKRAARYYVDTGDCLFCSVAYAKKGQEHEQQCTFYGVDLRNEPR
jgi:hypothetical protein